MQLSLIKKLKLSNIHDIVSSTAFGKESCVFLCIDGNKKYKLLATNADELIEIDLLYTEKSYQSESKPVLFSVDSHFGVIKNAEELLLFSGAEASAKVIKIDNRQNLPSRICLHYPSPVNDENIVPVCFERDVFFGEPRYIAFLSIDTQNFTAHWQGSVVIDSTAFAYHKDHSYPPKLDSVLYKNRELSVFTSGGQTTSVNKWGMDYYACLKCNLSGEITDKVLDSGNLHAIDQKKRGVNGIFTASKEYLILTPVFQSDEWKGKQRIFSLTTNEIFEVGFPRGFGKNAKLIQHYADIFWIYIKDNEELALCAK